MKHTHKYHFVDVVVLGKFVFRVYKCSKCGKQKLIGVKEN